MKILKFKSFVAAIVLSAFAFMACEETTDPVDNNPTKPAPPTKLMATSVSANSIKITWTPSTSETSSDFQDYVLTVTPGTLPTMNVVKTARPYLISNLDEGVEYTITLKARNKDGVLSDAATVIWAPAARFESDIKIYEYASNNGSGLNLYNADLTPGRPQNLKVSNKAQWDVALDTRNGKLIFGAARNNQFKDMESSQITPTPVTEISEIYFNEAGVNSLDDIFDSEALSTYTNWQARVLDLNDNEQFNPNYNLVLVVRTKDSEASTEWNYAKILIRSIGGKFLQGSGIDEYLDMHISYQTEAGVPYARPR